MFDPGDEKGYALAVAAPPGLKQYDLRKAALAWLLKTRTILRSEWIASQLGGGHPSFATRAVRPLRAADTPEMDRMKTALLEYLD